jgi:hypothetical protein
MPMEMEKIMNKAPINQELNKKLLRIIMNIRVLQVLPEKISPFLYIS